MLYFIGFKWLDMFVSLHICLGCWMCARYVGSRWFKCQQFLLDNMSGLRLDLPWPQSPLAPSTPRCHQPTGDHGLSSPYPNTGALVCVESGREAAQCAAPPTSANRFIFISNVFLFTKMHFQLIGSNQKERQKRCNLQQDQTNKQTNAVQFTAAEFCTAGKRYFCLCTN